MTDSTSLGADAIIGDRQTENDYIAADRRRTALEFAIRCEPRAGSPVIVKMAEDFVRFLSGVDAVR